MTADKNHAVSRLDCLLTKIKQSQVSPADKNQAVPADKIHAGYYLFYRKNNRQTKLTK